MLAEDAAWSMPPLAAWYGGLEEIPASSSSARCRASGGGATCRRTSNGQAAVGAYTWDEAEGALPAVRARRPDARGDRIKEVTSFIVRTIDSEHPDYYPNFPEQPVDEQQVAGKFAALGLPARLT